MKILLIEDERMTRVALTGTLRKGGHEVTPCPDGDVAMAALDGERFDLVLTDLNLPGANGMDILTRARQDDAEAKVVIMTAYASAETAVEALRQGAYDYVIKPFQTDEILALVGRVDQLHSVVEENRVLRSRIEQESDRRIVGDSPGMQKLNKTIESVAPGDFNILIRGPSGTGKELVARALHDASSRADGPFVAINCSAIPESLLESELFGYRKGAFTGAVRDHDGYFARAGGGSLFIDDIDDLPLTTQVKLLRVIQEREVEPVGGGGSVAVDFRLIAATKEDLLALSEQGEFRADLYYRLNVIPVKLPTLAERREDIPALIEHFVALHGAKEELRISSAQFEALMAYHWPGNVRELENVVERMLALPDVEITDLFDMPLRRTPGDPEASGFSRPRPGGDDADGIPGYREHMRDCEQELLRWALQEADGNISVAARILDLPRSTLRSKLQKP